MKDITAIANQLIGKTIAKVELPKDADEGIVLTFSDDTTLECMWSGCEGEAKLNGNIIEVSN